MFDQIKQLKSHLSLLSYLWIQDKQRTSEQAENEKNEFETN